MRAANIPQALIDQHINNILDDAAPGTNRSPSRPSGYRQGQIVSRSTIENARAQCQPRLGGSGQPRVPRAPGRVATRAIAPLTVYLTLRDALAAAGHNGLNLEPINAPYYYVAGDGSVFVVEYYEWPLSMFNNPWRRYIAGPRSGETEEITSAQFQQHRSEAEAIWGRYTPGGLFSRARFEPGTHRTRIPITNSSGQQIGHVDRDGPHYYYEPIGRPGGA